MKNVIFLNLSLLLVTAALAPAATRLVRDEYIPNEIIVKFRETVTGMIEEEPEFGKSSGELTLSQVLDEFDAKHRISDIKPLFKNFRRNRQRLRALQGKSKSLLTQKEKRILRRLQRVAKDAGVPNLSSIYRIQVDPEPGQSLQEVVEAYQNSPGVKYAEFNYIVSIDNSPNDPLYPLQWPLNNTGQDYPASGKYKDPPGTPDCDIDAPEAWDINTGSSEVIIAVLDTGVDYTHRDLDDNLWVNEAELNGTSGFDDDENGYVDDVYGYDFINNDSNPIDDHGHGTHTSGTIAAEGNNGLDIAGVCWNGRIMALKFLGSDGAGPISEAVTALIYAVDNGADVVSNSWGGNAPSETLRQAIDYAHSQGVIVVAAAGNYGLSLPHYPAYYEHVIAVAATDSNDEKALFSSFGDWVDISAPGVDVLSLRAGGTSLGTIYDSSTTIASGTSMACPHVAGVAALIISKYPEASAQYVTARLLETDDISNENPNYEGLLGTGRLNAFKAVRDGFEGLVNLDRDFYPCDNIVSIEVLDLDLTGAGTQQVTVTSDGGDEETVTLVQDVDSPWVFTGTIYASTGSGAIEDGTLQVSHGQTITATYYDANDGSGSGAVVEATATIDCEAPLIFNVEVIDITSIAATVRFETNEPAKVFVSCGLICGGPYTITAEDVTLATSHTVYLTGLASETDYYFVIDAIDAAGNMTTADNEGRCYSLTTPLPSPTLHVPSDYATIQAAIDAASPGGTIVVADGTYTGEGNRDIDFNGKTITVRSKNGPDRCIISLNDIESDPHRAFSFHSKEDADSILDGFTIINVYPIKPDTIRCYDSSPTIINCKITDGGIYCIYKSSPIISNCVISSHSGDYAISCYNDCSPIISNCTIGDKLNLEPGSGILIMLGSSVTINNCIISNNLSVSGAGVNCSGSDVTINNCTLSGNSAGIKGGGIYNDGATVVLTNCILWGNSDSGGADESAQIHTDGGLSVVNYNCIQGWTNALGGMGNIGDDPCFVDPNNSNYHLTSEAGRWDRHVYNAVDLIGDGIINLLDFGILAGSWGQEEANLPADLDFDGIVGMSDLRMLTDEYLTSYVPGVWVFDEVTSPCIDAGDLNSDWTAELWPHGRCMNMGAYGGTKQASMSLSGVGNIADLNADGFVDYLDMILFMGKWLDQEALLPEDLDRNAIVNFSDFAIFVDEWLWQE